jgi:hypothetical protein
MPLPRSLVSLYPLRQMCHALAIMRIFEIGLGILIIAVPVALPLAWFDTPLWADLACVVSGLFLIAHGTSGKKKDLGVNRKEPVRLNIPEMEITLHEGFPYEATGESQGKTVSTVRIGIKNWGDTDLTGCKVYIDAIDPMPATGETPIVLNEGLILPHGYPEVLVDIASQLEDMNQYSFASAEPSSYLDDKTPRSIVVKVEASECQRSASFRIWTDDKKHLHIRLISHIS